LEENDLALSVEQLPMVSLALSMEMVLKFRISLSKAQKIMLASSVPHKVDHMLVSGFTISNSAMSSSKIQGISVALSLVHSAVLSLMV
jgi:hypothetical protein